MFSILRGCLRSCWLHTAYCLSENLEKPVVKRLPESPMKTTLEALVPEWAWPWVMNSLKK